MINNIIYGSVLDGKTMMLSNISNELASAGYMVAFCSAFTEGLKFENNIVYTSNWKERYSKSNITDLKKLIRLHTIDFLIIDDISIIPKQISTELLLLNCDKFMTWNLSHEVSSNTISLYDSLFENKYDISYLNKNGIYDILLPYIRDKKIDTITK